MFSLYLELGNVRQVKQEADRPSISLGGKTLSENAMSSVKKTPFMDEIEANYGPSKETIREQHYPTGLAIRKLK